ncbi:DJ-1/PfpI family protein [Mycobacterium kansasii 662]|uniref:DJ-1/PfpI family protein n=1 Tax=Mycobacterium kansasii 662 TaxID=1299326 RepID=X7XWA0_MYCKA|nr:DJ-1/PfpI family protein [Mycobacterium kansasii]ETZ99098.1 DJ-1/PfpI family protein [Mycobacterium kansasii 662]
MRADAKLLDWLRGLTGTASWTTSVCSGSVILAAAGLLKDRRADVALADPSGAEGFGAIPVADERIVRAGNVITSAGVSAGLDLALWLAGKSAAKVAQGDQLAIEYDHSPRSTPATCRRHRLPPRRGNGSNCRRTVSSRPT